MDQEITEYNSRQNSEHRSVCELLAAEIDKHLRGAESKIWHAHPSGFSTGTLLLATASRSPEFD